MLLKIPHRLSYRQATVPQATVPHALMAKVLRSVIHSLSLYLDDALSAQALIASCSAQFLTHDLSCSSTRS